MFQKHPDREGGFTLIELLIAIVVLGIIMSALATGFIAALRGTAGAHDRFVASNAAQTLASVFTADVQSANPSSVSTGIVDTGCATTPAGGTNVLRLQWTEQTGTTLTKAFSAAYRTEPSGSEWKLTRYYCGQRTVTDGVTANLSTTLTSATAGFTSSDIGMTVSGTNIQSNTKIQSITDASHAVMDKSATGAGVGLSIVIAQASPSSRTAAANIYDPTHQTVVNDGVTTSGGKVVTSATAAFSSLDVGQAISGSGIASGTTIAAVTSGTQATLSSNAGSSATAVTFTINRYKPLVAISGQKITLTMISALGEGETTPYSYSLSANMRTASSQTLSVTTSPASQAAGSAVSMTVTALNDGATDTTYTGTVHFTSSDAQAVLPADYTFLSGDNGVHTFTSTLKTSGSQTITATDTSATSRTGSGSLTVTAAAHSAFTVAAPGTSIANSPFSVTVTAVDTYGNTVTSYTGAVKFTSSDTAAVLPANYTFVAGDSGVHTFSNGVTLKTAGSRTVTASTTTAPTKTGTATVSVTAASLAAFTFSAPASATAGLPFSVSVTAKDSVGATVTSYTGTVKFTSTDGSAVLPGDYTFVSGDSGTHTFTGGVTLKTAGSPTVTATDSVQTTVSGSASPTVSPATAATFTVSAPATASTGTAFNVTVTAKDSYGNTATSYTGSKSISWSGPSSSPSGNAPTYPASVTFASGAGTASVTLYKAETKALTATQGSVTGTSGSITVTATPVLTFANCSKNGGAAGSCTSVSVGNNGYMDGYVSVSDPYGNGINAGAWTVSVSSDDPQFVVTNSPVVITSPATQSATTFHVKYNGTGNGSATLTAHATSGTANDGTMTVGH